LKTTNSLIMNIRGNNNYHRKLDSSANFQLNFLPSSKQKYAFDYLGSNDHGIFSTNEFYPKSANGYDFLYKSVETLKTDYVKVDFSNYNDLKDSVIFKDRYGIKLKLSKDNILTFTGTQKPDTNYIYAYDNSGQRIGKLFVYTYKKQTKNVVLVSVNNAKIDKSITASGLNKIFKPAVTEFIISEDKIEIPDLETFTHGGSNWHSVYNSDQKLVLETYDKNIKDDNFYLFFVDNVLDKKDSLGTSVSGYMPRGYNCGFIYEGGSLHTVAHELGHGVGNLEHAFYSSNNSGKTQNLMDYSSGTEHYHFQWNEIQDPSRVWLKWRKEESEGENVEGVKWNLINLSIQNLNSKDEITLVKDPLPTINITLSKNNIASFALLKNSEFKVTIKFELDKKIQDFEINGQITDKKFIQNAEKQNIELKRISCDKIEENDNIEENKSNKNYYLAEFSCPKKLSNSIDYFDNFTIDWKIKYNEKETFLETSKNKILILNKINIIEIPLYETIVDIVCRNAQHKNEPKEIIEAIWTDFSNLKMQNINGEPLYYWLNGSSDNGEAQNINGLLGNHNGTCLAWAKLFYFILKSQGIQSEIYQIQCCDEINQKYNYSSLIATKAFKFSSINEADLQNDFVYEVSNETNIKCNENCNDALGQNNKNPICTFKNHYVVVCNEILYDPSYGTKFVSNGNENIFDLWENASIGAFLILKSNKKRYAKPNDKNVREIKFSKSIIREELK
ncbi:MAG: hypothetical protein MJ211_16060, partial [Bacteroidales bacterium]|nr:hypothetical protein [Bacteroidales bacterium]